MKNVLLLAAFLFLGVSFAGIASAATLNVSADPSSIAVGDTATFTVTIDTEGVPINAAEATIRYPQDLLEISSIDSSDSLFNFWVQEPSFSNDTGTITFLGGATNGYDGATLRLFRIHGKAKAEGSGDMLITSGKITASDGDGTNVLTSMGRASITVTSSPVSGSLPAQIVREPTPSIVLPPAPVVSIPSYPDAKAWYSTLSPFIARWDIPTDITDVSTAVDQNSAFTPKVSEGLFDNKIFQLPGDGTWYLHVRFKNALGWGDTQTVPISIDTIPPAAYQISVQPTTTTDVPSPILSFQTADPLSGLQTYTISVDSTDTVQTSDSTYTVPALSPGKHSIIVRAVDHAGNSTDATTEITTVPLTSPTISPITRTVYVNEGGLTVEGTSPYPDGKIFLELRQKSGELIESSVVSPNANGTWSATFEHPLKQDSYAIAAVAHDARDAQSLPVFATFSVVTRPFFILAGIQMSQTVFFSFIIILLGLGYVLGWWIEKKHKEKRGWHMIIAQRDVDSAFNQVQKDLDDMIERHETKKLTGTHAEEMILVAKRLTERIRKTKQYIIDHIEEINS